jgi:hypothetical protein
LNQLQQISDFGEYLRSLVLNPKTDDNAEFLHTEIAKARYYNHWFTDVFVTKRLLSIADFITGKSFQEFFQKVESVSEKSKFIGISSEEHIPLEEFSSLVTILISGNSFQYKTSDKSDKVLPFIFGLLANQIPEFQTKIKFSPEPLRKVDALFFSQREKGNETKIQYLKIKESLLDFRPQSVALLSGEETNEEILLLGNDIFNYFGQGAGNVRKIYIPQGYDVRRFFENIENHYPVMEHSPYANNYQYHQSVYLMNRITHLDNGFLLLKEDSGLRAPTGAMYYTYYENYQSLHADLNNNLSVSNIYVSSPKVSKDKAFGDSINQLLLPSNQLIDLLR